VKKLGKSIIALPFMQHALAFLMVFWLRVIYATSHKTVHFSDAVKPYFTGEKQAIFCFWHGRMIMQAFLTPPGRGMKILISHHRDGTLITKVLAGFKVGVVRGSSNKGGAEAFLVLRQEAAAGNNIGITPDGPRGPVYVAAPGAAHLAMVTGLPIIPVSFSATRLRRFKSWDQFILPKLGGDIIYYAEDPLVFTTGEEEKTVEQASAELSQALNRAMQRSDKLAGYYV